MTPTGSLSRAATGIAVYSVWLGFAGRGFSTHTFHRQINGLRRCNRWSPESWQNCGRRSSAPNSALLPWRCSHYLSLRTSAYTSEYVHVRERCQHVRDQQCREGAGLRGEKGSAVEKGLIGSGGGLRRAS